MSHALVLNASLGDAAAVPEGHVVIVRVVIIVEGPVGAEVHLHRLLWVLNRHAGADEDEALHLLASSALTSWQVPGSVATSLESNGASDDD